MKFSKKIFFVILGVIFLIALNVFGFYLNQEGLRISDSLEHAQTKQQEQFIKNKEFPFSEIIIYLVFIFDLAIILFLLFMILKFIFKKLKTSKI